MDFATLNASPRIAAGKSPVRRLRREGRIPAVAYGRTLSSMPIAIDPARLVKILQGPQGLNTVMKLEVEGGKQTDLLVMVREIVHHPLTRKFLHADFVQVKLEEDVDVEVPFITTGKPAGIVQGGILHQIYRKLPLRARPNNIPVNVTVDVTPLELGQHLKTSDLKLPEGVKVRLPAEQSIVGVVAPEKDRSAEEEAAAAAGAPGAAPAAGAAAPAAGAKGAAPAAGAAAAPAAGAKAAAAPAKKK